MLSCEGQCTCMFDRVVLSYSIQDFKYIFNYYTCACVGRVACSLAFLRTLIHFSGFLLIVLLLLEVSGLLVGICSARRRRPYFL